MATITSIPFIPQVAFHPGVTLSEKLEELGMSAKEFAVRTAKPEKTIIAVLKGKSVLTPDMAVLFESVTGIPANFWMKKQQLYSEFIAKQKREKKIVADVEWGNQFPVKEMQNRKWLHLEDNKPRSKVIALYNYFAVSTKEAWEDYYFNNPLKLAFRISLSQTKNPYAVSAWLRRGELQADKVLLEKKFSIDLLRKTIPEMKRLISDTSSDMPKKLQDVCLKCGIKLIYTECLPKAPISGATRWLQGVPCIQLSGRYKTLDKFWFNFFHEIGHIMLHGKKQIFIEDIEYPSRQQNKEEEANVFASNTLIDPKTEREIMSVNHFTKDVILYLSKEYKIEPFIIIGRLQHNNVIHFSKYHDLIPNVILDYS